MPSLSVYKSSLPYSYAPGFFPAMECILHRPQCVKRILFSESSRDTQGAAKLMDAAKKLNIRWEYADRVLRQVSQKENTFAAAVFDKFEDSLSNGPHIMLHCPGDTGNVGTILRTALAFGMEDVCLIKPCVDLFDPKTVRASMGSLFSLRVHVYDTFEAYREAFPDHFLYPFMLDASVPMEEVLKEKLPSRFTLVFGNEGSGLPPFFSALGQPVRIDSSSKVDSLNLSVAAAIGIYRFSHCAGTSLPQL